MEWQKLKETLQSMDDKDFERLVAKLLQSLLEIPFVVARSGDQPSGDARSTTGEVCVQAKKYKDTTRLDTTSIEGDIRRTIRTLPHLDVYVLAASRETAQLRDTLDAVEEETGLDIVTLGLSSELSDLGAVCVTFWDKVKDFPNFAALSQAFHDWLLKEKTNATTKERIETLREKLQYGIQTRQRVWKDAHEFLLKCFDPASRFNRHQVDLSNAIQRPSLEQGIMEWWNDTTKPICYLEGEEGCGKSWLAAKCALSISEDQQIVTFWLDSDRWNCCESLADLSRVSLQCIYPPEDEKKIIKLQSKALKIWRQPTLIVLDGVNEHNAIKAVKKILHDYFTHERKARIRILLTTRPLKEFAYNLGKECHPIFVQPFDEKELEEALTREGLDVTQFPPTLKDVAKIPRYFQTCVRLRNRLRSIDNVTKELVLWADLVKKISKTDPQILQQLGWQDVSDAETILSELAKRVEWTDANAPPRASYQLLNECFSGDYPRIRQDLQEQRIALGLFQDMLERYGNLYLSKKWRGYRTFSFSSHSRLATFLSSSPTAIE